MSSINLVKLLDLLQHYRKYEGIFLRGDLLQENSLDFWPQKSVWRPALSNLGVKRKSKIKRLENHRLKILSFCDIWVKIDPAISKRHPISIRTTQVSDNYVLVRKIDVSPTLIDMGSIPTTRGLGDEELCWVTKPKTEHFKTSATKIANKKHETFNNT